jgi:hypothetical protein
MQSELEYKLKHMKHNHDTTSAKVERGVVKGLQTFSQIIENIRQNASLSQEEAHKAYLMAEQAFLTSQKIDERQKKSMEAERHADAARYNTLKAQLPTE